VNCISTGDTYGDFNLQIGDIPPVCKMPYLYIPHICRQCWVNIGLCSGIPRSLGVAWVLLGCLIGLGFGLVFGCMSPVDMIFKYACVCVCFRPELLRQLQAVS